MSSFDFNVRLQEAMKHLRKAAELITSSSRAARRGGKEAGGIVEVCEYNAMS